MNSDNTIDLLQQRIISAYDELCKTNTQVVQFTQKEPSGKFTLGAAMTKITYQYQQVPIPYSDKFDIVQRTSNEFEPRELGKNELYNIRQFIERAMTSGVAEKDMMTIKYAGAT